MSTAFETEMGILPEIAKAIEEMEWNLPTDIQSDAIPLILGGGDVLMAAETGSGKTGAFCLPVLQIVYETLTEKDIVGRAKTAEGEPKWRMNVFDRTPAMAIDTEAMLCQSRDKQAWHGCRANKGVRGSGKHYFECTVTDDGLCRVGWSTIDAKLDLGTCPLGFGFGGTGKKSNNRQFSEYGSSFTLGDTIGNCLDLNSQEIRWYKNKQDLGMAFKIPPKLSRETFYPAVCMKNAELRFNFGAIPMISLPESYSAVCNANVESVVMSIKGSDNISIVPLKRKGPLAIIIEPSRELAEQTFKQLQLFKKHLNPCPRVSLIVGGMDTRAQQNELNQVVDIVVGTPGRLQDLIEGCILHLESVRFFVLDECDGLLSQGHKLLIENIHQKLPKISQNGCTRLQMIVCSATLHSFEVKKLADSLMHFPQWVDLKGEDSVPETVHHVVCVVSPREDKSWQQKVDNRGSTSSLAIDDGVHNRDRLSTSVESPEMMSEAVKLLKPSYIIDVIRILKIDRSLIFCRTKLDCDNLEKMFISLGGGPNHEKHEFSCVCLHSDRNAGERTRNLDKFKNTQVRFLVCTDIAARGLDIKGLPYVINMTLPDEKENYVHRIGRVGRAERMGLAISFVSDVKEKVWYHSNCTNRGKGCFNTDLITEKGCCIWYNEMKLLSDVEEHLGLTIDQIGRDFKIETNTFDGKVVYGQKMSKRQVTDNTQRDLLAPAVKQLVQLESLCQTTYMKIFFGL